MGILAINVFCGVCGKSIELVDLREEGVDIVTDRVKISNVDRRRRRGF